MNAEDRYDSLIKYYAAEVAFDWMLLKAQIKAESNFNPDAKSPVGALGLCQFMPKTWAEWADGTPGIQDGIFLSQKLMDARDPEDAIMAQACYLDWIKRFINDPDIRWTFAAYNWGPTVTKKFIGRHAGESFDILQENLPKETRDYVKRISDYYTAYKSEAAK
jgi:soluble lytic murein transglycosylase-like protein